MIEQKKMVAEVKPELSKDKLDLSNFDTKFTGLIPKESSISGSKVKNVKKNEHKFGQALGLIGKRHESEYRVKTFLTNDQITFSDSAEIDFIPSKCNWFEVIDAGVRFGSESYLP